MGTQLYLWLWSRDKIYSAVDQIPDEVYWENALVLGAGLRADGSPSRVLQDRVVAAAQLYHQGKVERLVLSGADHGGTTNEAKAMELAARDLGVPASALVSDSGAFTTLENCQRSGKNFQLEKAVVVTQAFHLPRSLYLCEHFGIQSIGLKADRGHYRLSSRLKWQVRELFANLKALWQLNF